MSFLIALVMAFLVWVLIWRTKLGYEMRTLGLSPTAAVYAGIPYARTVIIAMLLSGGLAGMMALNPVMGASARLQVEFVGGAGFVGIAVALMGRNHPVGIILAAILFGMLYQGGDGALLRHAEHHARHDRGHPGPGDPVCRRTRISCSAPRFVRIYQTFARA